MVHRKYFSYYLDFFRRSSSWTLAHKSYRLCSNVAWFNFWMFLKILINRSYNHLLPTVDFKMSDRKVSVKTLNEQCKALRVPVRKAYRIKMLHWRMESHLIHSPRGLKIKEIKKKQNKKIKKQNYLKAFEKQLFDVNN